MTRYYQKIAESSRREYIKFLIVILVLAASATLMSTNVMFHWTAWLRWFVGGFLLVSGSFKLIGYESFTSVFHRYDFIARRQPSYAYLYPFIQMILGVWYMLGIGSLFRNLIVFSVMFVGLFAVVKGLLRSGPTGHCVCLPHVLKLPLSTLLLFESLVITFMVFLLLVASALGL